jgi:heme/copper-type cytochrome/quinol oxidase subunit 3
VSASSPDPQELTAGLSVLSEPAAARADDIRQVTGNVTVGARLLSSAAAFLFISILFGYFYLKTVNSNDLWRPKGVGPVQSWGIAVLVLMILSTLVFDFSRRALVGGLERSWRSGGVVALVLALLVIVAQGLEWATISFKTDQGGWASVFWGWTAVELLFWLAAVYWVETLVAQTFRRPAASPREGSLGSELLRPSADAGAVYLYTLLGVEIVAYILLYVIK